MVRSRRDADIRSTPLLLSHHFNGVFSNGLSNFDERRNAGLEPAARLLF